MRLITIKDAIVTLGESIDWTEIAMLTAGDDVVWSEDRLTRSQKWGDPDYSGHALNVLNRLVKRNPQNELIIVQHVLSNESLARWDPQLHERLQNISDYLRGSGLLVTEDFASIPHLQPYVDRIKAGVISDPEAALGSCKDLVESALKTFLDMPADAPDRKTMPQLIKAARGKLSDSLGGLEHIDDMLRMLSNFGQILESIATVRNRYGTGHGRGPFGTFQLPQPYVVLAANAAISAAVFLTQMRDEMSDGEFGGTQRMRRDGTNPVSSRASDPDLYDAIQRAQSQQSIPSWARPLPEGLESGPE